MMFISSRTQKINDRLFIIRDIIVNLFVYKADDAVILIDTGMRPGNLKKALKRFGVDSSDVRHILLTHTDSDHAGNLNLFPNAMVYLSKDEEQMINGTTPRFGKRGNKPLNSSRTLLEDGRLMEIGGTKVLCIATPGHTPGSMSYLVDDAYLFVGDCMSLTRGKAHNFPGMINMDINTQKHSLVKLAGLKGVKMAFTGHSGFTGDYDNAMKGWRHN